MVRSNWSRWTKERTPDGIEKDCKISKAQLSDARLLKLYKSDVEFIGLPLGETTRYFILDIDHGSRYNEPEQIRRLVGHFESRRIKVHVCQSSTSGGLHLIGIFTRRIKTSRLIKFLNACLRYHGYELFGGHLEVWPSESTKNKPIRLPFQNQQGFYLLNIDNDLQPCRYFTAFEERIRTFLSLPQTDPDDPSVNLKLPTVKADLVNTAGRIQEVYNLGEQYYINGLSGPHQRYEALKAISHYLFYNGYGYDRKKERQHLMERWMREKNNGWSNDWNRNPKSVLAHRQLGATWTETLKRECLEICKTQCGKDRPQ